MVEISTQPNGSFHLVADSAPLVREIIDAYLADRRLDLLAGKIESKYFKCLSHYVGVFRRDYGHVPVDTLPRTILRKWLRNHPEWKSGYSCDDACGSVITCMRWAVDEETWKGFIPSLKRPADLIPGKLVQRPLTNDEYRAVIRQSRKAGRPSTRRAFRFAMRFLWRCGARTCEMRTAEVANLDLVAGMLKVRHKTQRKTGGMRTIPLDEFLVRLIRVVLSGKRRLGVKTIFVNGRGRPWKCQAFADIFRLCADAAGVPKDVSAYAMRHAFSCRARSKDISADDVSDITGNSPAIIRKHYDAWQRSQPDHLQRIMKAVNGGGR